jgi:predicted transcriptional regulator
VEKMPTVKKGRGRPPRREGERLSKNRTFRVRGDLDTKLIRAANKSGRSVSEEIEYRLERSFDREADRQAILQEFMAAANARSEAEGKPTRLVEIDGVQEKRGKK